MGKQCDLLLKDQESECLLCYVMGVVVQVLNVVWAFFCFYILIVHVCRQWAGPIDRCDSRHINDVAGFCSDTELLCALLRELEDPSPFAGVKDILIYLLII